jgi:hypothetical protein
MRRRPDHVYIIGRQHGGLVKVGVSHQPRCRMYNLQGSSGVQLYLFWEEHHPNAETVERSAHSFLAPNRVMGEWFAVSPEAALDAVRAAISAHAGRPPVPATVRRVNVGDLHTRGRMAQEALRWIPRLGPLAVGLAATARRIVRDVDREIRSIESFPVRRRGRRGPTVPLLRSDYSPSVLVGINPVPSSDKPEGVV